MFLLPNTGTPLAAFIQIGLTCLSSCIRRSNAATNAATAVTMVLVPDQTIGWPSSVHPFGNAGFCSFKKDKSW